MLLCDSKCVCVWGGGGGLKTLFLSNFLYFSKKWSLCILQRETIIVCLTEAFFYGLYLVFFNWLYLSVFFPVYKCCS